MSEFLVDMRGVCKRFPGVRANERVDFQVRRGEIHALLGENGAGKSTLMSILSGLYRPDEGEIYLQGKRVDLKSPRDALNHGIGMVHQHFRLIETFTVTENVVLGTATGSLLKINSKELADRVGRYSGEYGLDVDPGSKVWQLSVGEKQRVEILKLLYRGAELLILDEPTAVLTPQEVRDLFQTLRRMAAGGKSVILITHKLQEVMEVADRITVLSKGMNVGTVDKGATDARELTKMMVNREVLFSTSRCSQSGETTVLRLEHLRVRGDRGTGLKDISLEVKAGEVLGIAGIAGNGQRELAEAVTGLRAIAGGHLYLAGQDFTNRQPREYIDAGVGSIPEDRLGTGLVPNLDLYDNLILKDYHRPPVSRGILVNHQEVALRARQLVDEFKIQVSDFGYPVRMLSGGNLQRLLLAREIHLHPKLVVASSPVRGLDVGATEAVYQLLLGLCRAGTAILLISEDLEEIMTLSDRIAVIFRGEIMGVYPAAEAGIEQLGLLMVGGKKTEVEKA